MCLWSFVLGEVCSWIFLIELICGDSHCEEFFILRDFFNGFFFWNFFFYYFRLFHCEDLFNCSSLRLKNCFSLLVLRHKIFVLVIWLRVIGLVSDFKMDTNSGLEFGILIDSGSELKFWNDLSTLVVYLGRLFAQLSWFYCFLMCLWNFEFGDYFEFSDCFMIIGMTGFVWLKWVWPNWIGFGWNFANFQANDPSFFFFFFQRTLLFWFFWVWLIKFEMGSYFGLAPFGWNLMIC